ncbi:MAG: hypothetical protein KatS3mg129_1308 [Leptospiraceae bacterium]|nr:MAG: hypothetical protein KatS3mg129_1308 [Leptospiraceae bacterium]
MFGILIRLMGLISLIILVWFYSCVGCWKLSVKSCLDRFNYDCSKVYINEKGEKDCIFERKNQSYWCCGNLIAYCKDPEFVKKEVLTCKP